MTHLEMSVAAALAWLVLLVVAVWRRWFARWRRGFFAMLVAAFLGIGLATAALLGAWSYRHAQNLIAQQRAEEIENAALTLERDLRISVERALGQMNDLGRFFGESLAPGAEGRVRGLLREVLETNRQFQQLSFFDSQGRLVAAESLGPATEPESRVAAAFGLDGKPFVSDPYHSPVFRKTVILLGAPVKSPGGRFGGGLTARYDLGTVLEQLAESARFGGSGYAVLVGSDGRVLAHPEPSRLQEDLSAYPSVREGLLGRRGWTVHENRLGERRIFHYRPVVGPGKVEPKTMVLLAEMGEREADAPLRELRNSFLAGAAMVFAGCLLVAHLIAHAIRRPHSQMVRMVESVAQGDLTARVAETGADEIGILGSELNRMAEGLQERDRVKDLFGRYVTTQVSEEVLKGRVELGGAARRVTILFSDIRNFTSMSEQMAPAQVVEFLNTYFSEMVEAVFEQGGVLDKFIGDGMMAVFGSIGEMPDHPRRAVLAGLRMKALLGKINAERAVAGRPPIGIGIGIHTDEVIVGNIGSRKRLEYTVIGDGVNTCSRVEALNKSFGTTLLITEATYEAVKDEFECRLMPEAPLKGKTRSLQFYEVLSKNRDAPLFPNRDV